MNSQIIAYGLLNYAGKQKTVFIHGDNFGEMNPLNTSLFTYSLSGSYLKIDSRYFNNISEFTIS